MQLRWLVRRDGQLNDGVPRKCIPIARRGRRAIASQNTSIQIIFDRVTEQVSGQPSILRAFGVPETYAGNINYDVYGLTTYRCVNALKAFRKLRDVNFTLGQIYSKM